MINVTAKFTGDKEILRSFKPLFRDTRSSIGKTGKGLKGQLVTNAAVDSGRLVKAIEGDSSSKGNVFSYTVSIDTRKQGSKINYAWFFIEGGVTPKSGDRSKVRVIEKSLLTPKQKSMVPIAKQLGNKRKFVFFHRVSDAYRRRPFIKSVTLNAAGKHRYHLPKAIVSDLMRKGK